MKYVVISIPSPSGIPDRTRWGVGRLEDDGTVTFLMWVLDVPNREGAQAWVDDPGRLEARLAVVKANFIDQHQPASSRGGGWFGSRPYTPTTPDPKLRDWAKPPPPKRGIQTLGDALADGVQRSAADDAKNNSGDVAKQKENPTHDRTNQEG